RRCRATTWPIRTPPTSAWPASAATRSKTMPAAAAFRSSSPRSTSGPILATDPLLIYALVLAVGYVAGTVSGIVGTGATIILLPVLVFAFGPRQAIPIMAIVALMSNFAKITAWWRQIDWRACGAYALGGVPGAALGARTMLSLPPRTVDIALGTF